jgi:hypothetical protein
MEGESGPKKATDQCDVAKERNFHRLSPIKGNG